MINYDHNREEVDVLIETVKHNIDEFKQGVENLGGLQIEENISPMSFHEFNRLIKTIYLKLDYLIKLIIELKEFRNTENIFEELYDSLIGLEHETEFLSNDPTDIDKIQETIDIIEKSIIFLNSKIIPIRVSNQQSQQLIEENLEPKIKEIEEKIKDFESLRLALEHRETSSIYLELHNKYNEEYEKNNYYFFGTLILAVIITFLTSIKINTFNLFFTTKLSYWAIFITIKVLIISITITLCTLFLRRAAHAKKLKEQAYQTYVEIIAFPIHVRSLEKADKDELIKELAMKYFGKELDQTQNDKIGNLMQDQITSSTELIKASAEIVKNLKSEKPT